MVFGEGSLAEKAKNAFQGDSPKRTPEERKLLRKLDFFIMVYSCMSYLFNYLDRSAFANAYVAGLKEDIHLVGNQYSILLSLITAGMVIGQVPNALAIQKIAPHIWLPSMVVVWGALTMCSAACHSYAPLAAVRFLMGLAEASTYAGCIYVIGSWYTPKEIAKRTAWFTIAGQVGTMFAGVLMTSIHETMDGHAGLKGWQWVFIIDGLITMPVAVFGFFCFPDTPEKTRAKYLSESERQLALSRVPAKKSGYDSVEPWPLIKRVGRAPEFWCLIGFSASCAVLQAFPLQSLFLLFLKYYQDEAPFSQANINTYPLGVQAVGIVSELLAAEYLDRTGNRIVCGFAICLVQLTTAIILLIPDVSYAASFFAFYASGSAYAVNPLLYGSANTILSRGRDDAKRGVILACMAGTGQVMWTFWGIVLYPATDAPYWKKGAITMIVMCFVVSGVCFIINWLDGWSLRNAPEADSTSVQAMRAEPGEGSGDAEKAGGRDEVTKQVGV